MYTTIASILRVLCASFFLYSLYSLCLFLQLCILGFHHHCTTFRFLLHFVAHGKAGPHMGRRQRIFGFHIFRPPSNPWFASIIDSIHLFSFVGKIVLSKIKVRQTGFSLHGPLHSNFENKKWGLTFMRAMAHMQG